MDKHGMLKLINAVQRPQLSMDFLNRVLSEDSGHYLMLSLLTLKFVAAHCQAHPLTANNL